MAAVEQASPPGIELPGGRSPRIAFFHSCWTLGDHIFLGGSDYWRLGLPGAELYKNGWDVVLARNIASTPTGEMHVCDPMGNWHTDREIIVWAQWMGIGTVESMQKAKACGQVIINDIDDDYWALPKKHVAHKGTSTATRPEYNRELYREVLAASSLITTSTPELARRLEPLGVPIVTVRNYIDIDAWPLGAEGDHIGWVGMTPWRDDDLNLLKPTVVPWLRKHNRFFYHGGDVGDPKRSAARLLGYERTTTRPSQDMLGYSSLWEPLRTCLVPMQNSQFNRSRSWVKGLEACARGAAFVASNHSEYHELDAGRLVYSRKDWVRHIEALEDPDVWAADVARNRKRAEELTIQQHWPEWAGVYRSAVRI